MKQYMCGCVNHDDTNPKLHPVKTKDDGVCVLCGYYAVYTKVFDTGYVSVLDKRKGQHISLFNNHTKPDEDWICY